MKRTILVLAVLPLTSFAQYVPNPYMTGQGPNVYQGPTTYSTYGDPAGNTYTRGSDGSRFNTYSDPAGNTYTTGTDAAGNPVRCSSYSDAAGNVYTRCN